MTDANDTISRKAMLARMNAARDSNAGVTCPASRHAAMIAKALIDGSGYPMLTDDPKHCGETIAAVVAALWEARALPSVGVTEPTDAQTASACMSYRHDFGLMDEGNKASTMFIAREWLRAWRKALDVRPAPDVAALVDYIEKARAALARKGGDARINWRDDPNAVVEDDNPQIGRGYE